MVKPSRFEMKYSFKKKLNGNYIITPSFSKKLSYLFLSPLSNFTTINSLEAILSLESI